jgi:predicted secreted protein
MKKLVFAHALLPFGTVGEATAQTAHLQTAQGDPQSKFAKELFFATAQISCMIILFGSSI